MLHVVRRQIQADLRLRDPPRLPALIGGVRHDDLRDAVNQRGVGRPHAAVMDHQLRARQHVLERHEIEQARRFRQRGDQLAPCPPAQSDSSRSTTTGTKPTRAAACAAQLKKPRSPVKVVPSVTSASGASSGMAVSHSGGASSGGVGCAADEQRLRQQVVRVRRVPRRAEVADVQVRAEDRGRGTRRDS